MNYQCKYFTIQELVDKATFEKFGVQAWQFLNPLALQALDGLREFLNTPLIINNWANGGKYEFSGFRPRNCEIGAEYSQHRLGNAFDIKCVRYTPKEIVQKILDNKDHPLLKNINAVEDPEATPTWTHIDCRNVTDRERVKIVKP